MRLALGACGALGLLLAPAGGAAAANAGVGAAAETAAGEATLRRAAVPGEGAAPITMADFKVRMSNTYSTGNAAFAAMLQGESQPDAAPGQPGAALLLDAFVRGAARFRPPLNESEAMYAFRGLDSNRDGQLTQDEFLEVLWTGAFLPSSGPPQELGQALTTITSERASTTLAPTTTLQVSDYSVTDVVVQEEGESMGDYTDRSYTLKECKVLCDKEPGCNSFAYFNGDCHLKDRCVHASDPVQRSNDFRTYYKKCAPKTFVYEKLGTGYCPHGYYAGGDPFDAVNLARCQAKCNAEPQCEFISLHMKDTCSRYSSKAGDCQTRTMGKLDHVTYRRIPRPLPVPRVVHNGVSRLREGTASGSGAGGSTPSGSRTTAAFVPALRFKEPITMAEFKARMLKSYATSMHAFQALGTNPSGLDDFVRGVTTFEPPLTFEQAQYAFNGLDTDHDDMLRSFEFFEVIECGHFFPTSEELAELHESPRAFRVPSTSADQQGGQPSVPALTLAFGVLTCLFSVLLAMGLRLAGKVHKDSRESYTAMAFLPNENTNTLSTRSSNSGQQLVSL